MKSRKSKIKKSAMHIFLLATCLIMIIGVSSCSKEEFINNQSKPTAMDDASLLSWQMEKHFKTKAIPYNIAIITTKVSCTFDYLECNGSYTIDWGDGTTDTDINSHIYSDGLPAHTIFIYGDFNGQRLYASYLEVIFLDISGAPGLKGLDATYNRLTNIDLSRNTELESISLYENNLSSIDFTNNSKLITVAVQRNPLKTINVSMSPLLTNIQAFETLLTTLDISNNTKLLGLGISNTAISKIDLSNAPLLTTLTCHDAPISGNLDCSKNTLISQINCQNTNITSIDISNSPNIEKLTCSGSQLSNLICGNMNNLKLIMIVGAPIEQDRRKMTSLALALPDRNLPLPDGNIEIGKFWTKSPYASYVVTLLEGYNWEIIPNPQVSL